MVPTRHQHNPNPRLQKGLPTTFIIVQLAHLLLCWCGSQNSLVRYLRSHPHQLHYSVTRLALHNAVRINNTPSWQFSHTLTAPVLPTGSVDWNVELVWQGGNFPCTSDIFWHGSVCNWHVSLSQSMVQTTDLSCRQCKMNCDPDEQDDLAIHMHWPVHVTVEAPMDHLHHIPQLSVEFHTNNQPVNRRKRQIKLSICDDSTPHPRLTSTTAPRHLKIIFEN